MPTIECNNADIYYEEKGSGQPIVCLHGVWAGLRFFQPQLEGLSDRYRVIALDFRGHGRSSKTEMGHTLPQYARDLHVFLEKLGLKDVILVGWSMGALVCWDYFDQFGSDRLRALVDVDMEASRYKWQDYEYGTSDLDLLREIVSQIQTDHLAFIEKITYPLFKNKPIKEIRNLMIDELSMTPPSIKVAIIFDATFRDYREVLPRIDIPMLVCAGADEKWRPVANVRNVIELIPHAEFELFEESGHDITIEEPEKFNQVLAGFIQSLPLNA